MSGSINVRAEYALPADKPALRELFDLCFPGESGFSGWYFDNVWRSDNTLVIRQSGEIVSALQMLPMELEHGGDRISGCYIFAVGTYPNHRGEGLAGKLIQASFDECRRRGLDFSALIVQQSSLTDYYSRFGYEPIFTVRRSIIPAAPCAGEIVPVDKSHIPELDRVYRHSAEGLLFDSRSEARWSAQMDSYKALALRVDGAVTSYCFYDIRGGRLFAAEACGEHAEALVAAAAELEGKKEACMLTIDRDGIGEAIGCFMPLSRRAEQLRSSACGFYLNLYYN